MVSPISQVVGPASTVLQSNGGGAAGIFGIVMFLLYLAFIAVVVAGLWKIFEKADKPGWGALIPIYNVYLLIKIAGRPGWWLLLLFVPLLNILISFVIHIDIADRFGKDTIYGVAMTFLPFIFYPLLGFGDEQYQAA